MTSVFGDEGVATMERRHLLGKIVNGMKNVTMYTQRGEA